MGDFLFALSTTFMENICARWKTCAANGCLQARKVRETGRHEYIRTLVIPWQLFLHDFKMNKKVKK